LGQLAVECADAKLDMVILIYILLAILCFIFGLKDRKVASPGLFNLKRACLVMGISLSVAVIAHAFFSYNSTPQDDPKFCDQITTGIGICIFFFLILFMPIDNSCPSCDRWWVDEETGKEFVSSETHYEKITREDAVRDSERRLVYTIERPDTIAVETITHRHHYRCKICGHQWDKLHSKEKK
jgi:hypothetical protein